MKPTYTLLTFLLLTANNIFGQDTAFNEAENSEIIANKLYNTFKFDSAAFYYCKAANLYFNHRNWLKSVKNFRLAGNVFFKAAKRDTALHYIQMAYDVAEKYFDKNNKGEMLEKIDVLLVLANANNHFDKYKQELDFCKEALVLALVTDSTASLKIAEIWDETGVAYENLRNYDSAFYYCEKSLGIRLKLTGENSVDIAESYRNIGNLYDDLGNNKKALEFNQKALEIFIQVYGEKHWQVSRSYNNIGGIYENIGAFDKALDCYLKALQINIRVYGEDHPKIAQICNNIGVVYDAENEYDKALEFYQKALLINIRAFGITHPEVSRNYFNIGQVYQARGEYDKALEFVNKSLQINILVYDENSPEIARNYSGMGIIYYYKNRYDESVEYFQKAIQVQKTSYGEMHPNVELNYICLGIALVKKGECDKALELFQKALKIDVEVYGEINIQTAIVYNHIAEVYQIQKKYGNSLEFYQKSLKIINKFYNKQNEYIALNYNGMADVYKEMKKYGEALVCYQKALIANAIKFADKSYYSNPKEEDIVSKPLSLQIIANKAGTFYQRYKTHSSSLRDLDASLSTYDLAFKLINTMRNDYNNESTQLLLSENTKSYYAKAVHIAIESNKGIPKAFEYIENGKNATLAAKLNNYSAMQFAGIPDSLLKTERWLRNKISTLSTQIIDEKNTNGGEYDTLKVNSLENENFAYSRRLDSLVSSFETNYPNYYKLKYENKTASITEIQNSLDGNTAMLNYFVGDSTLFIATITNNLYNIREINIDSTFKDLVTKYIDIETANPQSFVSNSRYIYEKLIAPVKNEIAGKEHLIIIPDDYLYYLPFETLVENSGMVQMQDTTFTGYSNLAYLIKTHSVSYHHSATLWCQSVNKAKGQDVFPNNNFIGFAPVFSKDANNGLILSENIRNMAARAGSGENRSFTSDMKYLAPLPYSKDEVVSIGKLFERQRKKAEVYLYGSASEQNFKSKAGTYKYVHIASHGFSNDQESRLSGLIFSQPDSAGRNEQTDDGILYVGETYNLKLNADLVVLSSCESGLGKLIKGEGLQALSRGFMYAGTPNIMFSLWKVIDKPTKNLMVQFYANILDGKTYPEALRLAKLKLLSSPKTANPYLWGGFVLVGR